MNDYDNAEVESTDIEPRTRRALERVLTVTHTDGTPIREGESPTVVSVHSGNSGKERRVDVREGRCTCPDHEHRGARCKHLRRVAIEVTDGEVPPPTAPRVTEHLEHPDQGGARYYRCEACGRESVRERLRRQGCRHCIERETDDATDASAGYGGTAGLAADGGVETISHTEQTHE